MNLLSYPPEMLLLQPLCYFISVQELLDAHPHCRGAQVVSQGRVLGSF